MHLQRQSTLGVFSEIPEDSALTQIQRSLEQQGLPKEDKKKIQCSGALRTAHKGTMCTRFREQSLRMPTNSIQLDWEFRKPIIEAGVDTWAGVSIVLGKKFYNKLKSKPPSRNISLCCNPELEPNLGDICCWHIKHQCGSTHTSGWSICSPHQGLDAFGNGYRKASWTWSKVSSACVGKISSWLMVGIRPGVSPLYCCYTAPKPWGSIYYWAEGMLTIPVFYLLTWPVALATFPALSPRELGE